MPPTSKICDVLDRLLYRQEERSGRIPAGPLAGDRRSADNNGAHHHRMERAIVIVPSRLGEGVAPDGPRRHRARVERATIARHRVSRGVPVHPRDGPPTLTW